MVFGLLGCQAKRYRVDYDGNKGAYVGAEDSYRAGETVTVYYNRIATDTDYTFYLDSAYLPVDYDSSKGFIIRFAMPEHDVKLSMSMKNTMEYDPDSAAVFEEEMLMDYYAAAAATVGGDGYYEIVLYTCDRPGFLYLTVYTKNESGEETEISYFVPSEVLDKCMAVIRESGMPSWNERDDTVGLDGVKLVCKFKDGDEYIRVSSDEMPPDGKKDFDAVRDILQAYIREEYRA